MTLRMIAMSLQVNKIQNSILHKTKLLSEERLSAWTGRRHGEAATRERVDCKDDFPRRSQTKRKVFCYDVVDIPPEIPINTNPQTS